MSRGSKAPTKLKFDPTFSTIEKLGVASRPPETVEQGIARVHSEVKRSTEISLGLEPEDGPKTRRKHETKRGKDSQGSKSATQMAEPGPPPMMVVNETVEYVTFVNGKEQKIDNIKKFMKDEANPSGPRPEPKIKRTKVDQSGLIFVDSSLGVSTLVQNEKYVAVMYGSSMCLACVDAKALYERISTRYKTRLPQLKFVYVDIDKAGLVTATPTVRTWHNGKKIGESTGGGKQELERMRQTLAKLKELVV